MTPAFSVVMATFGRGRHVEPSIRSVLAQTESDLELLVVGDGCVDETERVVAGIGDARVRWIGLPDTSGSQSAPNNAGLAAARADWACYLGHDDLWAPGHLADVRAAIAADPGLDVVVAGCLYHGPRGSQTDWVTGLFDDPDAARRHFFPPSSVAHRREPIRRLGGWRDPLGLADPVDADLLRRAAGAGLRFGATGRVTVHKLAAGHRYLSYLRPSHAEQDALLAALRDDPGLTDRRVARAARGGRLMAMTYDGPAAAPGAVHARNRAQKGLGGGPPTPLTRAVVLRQADDPRALDWHALEGRVRWSGPSPRPRLLLPFTGADARVTIALAGLAPGARAQELGVWVEERPVAVAVHGDPDRLEVDLRLAPDRETVLTLHTPDVWCPAEALGSVDRRRLGVAVGDVTVAPL